MPHGVTRLVEDDFIIPSHYPFYFFSFLFSLSLSLSLSLPLTRTSLLSSSFFSFLLSPPFSPSRPAQPPLSVSFSSEPLFPSSLLLLPPQQPDALFSSLFSSSLQFASADPWERWSSRLCGCRERDFFVGILGGRKCRNDAMRFPLPFVLDFSLTL